MLKGVEIHFPAGQRLIGQGKIGKLHVFELHALLGHGFGHGSPDFFIHRAGETDFHHLFRKRGSRGGQKDEKKHGRLDDGGNIHDKPQSSVGCCD